MQALSLRDKYRKGFNLFMLINLCFLSVLAVAPFLFIVYYVLQQGVSAVNWDFFTQLPSAPGEEGGGMANAILGSLVVVGLASLLGLPWGMGMGIYLSEYKHTKTAVILRFIIDLLMSAPSIVVGIFIYGVLVVRYGFSAYAGAMALMIIILPVLTRGTEEILKMIPVHIREAGLALGLPRYKVILRVLVPGAGAMLITVVILSIARVAGETAPLLFTSLGNQYHITSLSEPTATLPVQIYELSKSGFKEMEQQAWAGAMVLVLFVFLINLFVRVFLYFCRRPATIRSQSP